MRLPRLALLLLVCAVPASGVRAQASRLDSLDAYVQAQMARRHIRGLSLAIIQNGRIDAARAYGVVDDSTRAPVTTATLFQAGSISKPVSALAALHLVEAGRLSLDGDVNAQLEGWKVPGNRFTTTEKVTLRRLLSHSAGVTVHGFPGYDTAGPVPSLVQVLDGAPPANTPPIRVDTVPGAIWRYSGGGFTIMQELVIDVTRTPFPRFMQQTVLGPIGMTSSSYEQPPTAARAALNAGGYYADRTPVRGRWHVYPEMAAAGLWTTPTDLARFAIEIQETLAGRGHGVISPAMARQYLTVQKAPSGLGIIVDSSGHALRFSHGGRDEGFDAQLVAFAHTGQGAAIMINANDNSRFMGRLLDYIARAWGWPMDDAAGHPAATRGTPVAAPLLAEYAGYYEAAENQMITLAPDARGDGLETLVDGLPDEAFLAIDSTRFGSSERPARFVVARDGQGAVGAVVWTSADGREHRMPRIAPLPSTVAPVADPDPALAGRIAAALDALHQGGSALAEARDVTPGAKQDFGAGIGSALDRSGPLTYVGETDVAGRGLHRHGGDVARVRYYRMPTSAGDRYLLVHLTAEGLVTDFDVVDR
ncbi:MAG TPA: serine hydrolase domain-containing protein [Gemmatimonadales bacterium]|nr:serine hydrolase domain-containing protein [Gemmatimonadales bacterium]